jgi:hypothetical protein
VNAEIQTGYNTQIDAGNGNELYISKSQPISPFNTIFGYPGLHEFAECKGRGK